MATRKTTGSTRRKAAPGQKLPRKVYPSVTAEQRRQGIAPAMEKFINKNYNDLVAQGNRKGVLDSGKKMARTKATGSLKKRWNAAAERGKSSVGKLISKRNMTASQAKTALAGAYKVKFQADPKRR